MTPDTKPDISQSTRDLPYPFMTLAAVLGLHLFLLVQPFFDIILLQRAKNEVLCSMEVVK